MSEFLDKLKKTKNFMGAVARATSAVLEGKEVKATESTSRKRWEICRSCEYMQIDKKNSEKGVCEKCGCGMHNKVWWASESCPQGKWSIDFEDKGGTVGIIIPSRNEPYLTRTVRDLLDGASGSIEIWVLLDGWDLCPNGRITWEDIATWKDQPLLLAQMQKEDSRIRVIEGAQSIGGRRGINLLASLTQTEYLLKVDAHMSFTQGYDLALKKYADDVTFCIPRLRKLYPETWTYGNTHTDFLYFDQEFQVKYWYDYPRRIDREAETVETIFHLGNSWCCSRKFWNDIGGHDPDLGFWAGCGVELSLKTWLSGRRMVVVMGATGSHFFRKKFPYLLSGREVKETRRRIKDIWTKNLPPGMIHDVAWLLEKFKPVPEWHDKARKIFIDCGMHEGESTKFFKRYHPEAPSFELFGFEVAPGSLEKLKELDGVEIINKAVWVGSRPKSFYLSTLRGQDGSTFYRGKVTGGLDLQNPIPVQCINFSEWLKTNFTPDDYIIIKMNIEGSEYDVLELMLREKTLRYVNKLFVQWHHAKITNFELKRHEELLRRIGDTGLKVYPWPLLFTKGVVREDCKNVIVKGFLE